MNHHSLPRGLHVVPLALVLLLASVSCHRAPSASPEYLAELEAWREQRLAKLQAEDGWLSLVGLFWLQEGRNSFGSADSCAVVLPDPHIPERAGSFELTSDGKVSVRTEPGIAMRCNGEPLESGRALASDAAGSPDLLELGRLHFYLIARGERLGVRVKDPEAETRIHFQGLEYFPIAPSMRVTARFEPYERAKEVRHATAIGTEEVASAPGLVHFELEGRALSLEPWAEDARSDLFFVFRDSTSGRSSYGAGRFLSAAAPENGEVVLDFNRAVNPPCAFTPYATCPLAPPANVLPVAIRAGERYSGHH